MQTFIFRAPGCPLPLDDLLRRAAPGLSDGDLSQALADGRVRLEGRVHRQAERLCDPGVLIRADLPATPPPEPPAHIPILARGDGWVVVDKPAGWPSHASRPDGPSARALVADSLDLPHQEVRPAHRLDAAVSGAWLLALTDDLASELGRAFERRQVDKVYEAVAPAPPWPGGRVEARLSGRSAATELETIGRLGPLAHLRLVPITGRTHQLRRHLALLGAPIVGDRRHGGVLVGGGIRLRATVLRVPALDIAAEAPWPDEPWPDEPVFAPARVALEMAVSQATVRALKARGHPWILTDTETTDPGRFEAGRLVHLVGPGGESAGWARVEGPGRIAARQWAPARRRGRGAGPSTEHRLRDALGRRAHLTAQARAGWTDAYRLVHGEADGLPGLAVDRLGSTLRLLLLGRAALPLLDPAADMLGGWLAEEMGADPRIIEVIHLRGRPAGPLACVRLRSGPALAPGERLWVRERGLTFEVDPGLDRPHRPRPGVGLFADQRENRERLAGLAAPGGRWLNLFAHTGAFSVALLAAGADEVVSVDLSRPYLDVLDRNLAANALAGGSAGAHRAVRSEARRFLERLDPGERFDGMVLDPPTAAASGRRFWSVRRDGATLLALALKHLPEGGHLLLCRNDRRARGTLEPLVRAVAKDLCRSITAIRPAPPSPDFPRLEGFPEGDAFEGVVIRF